MRREDIAKETVHIVEQGLYQSPNGRQVDLAAHLLECVTNTQCYDPDTLSSLTSSQVPRQMPELFIGMNRALAAKIEGVLRERATKFLGLAAHYKCDALILGAWGCGVFRNER